MKRKVIAVLMLVGMLLGGCGQKNTPPVAAEAAEAYLVPITFLSVMGSSREGFVHEVSGICTDACIVEDGVWALFTAEQKAALFRHYEDWNQSWRQKFLEMDESYHYEQDLENRTAELYFDSKIEPSVLLGITSMVIFEGAMYQLFEERDADWNVQLSIYNSKTGKLVTSGNLPYDEVVVNEETWRQSE